MLPTQAGSSPGNGIGRSPALTLSRSRSGNGSSQGRGSRPRYEVSPGTGSGMYSGSEVTSDSADDDDTPARGMKRGLAELELPDAGVPGGAGGVTSVGYPGAPVAVSGAKPGKKTRGRVKIKMEFIDNKLRRYTTFSKRKTGIMKKVRGLVCLHCVLLACYSMRSSDLL